MTGDPLSRIDWRLNVVAWLLAAAIVAGLADLALLFLIDAKLGAP